MFSSNLNFCFSIICFSEIWLNDSNLDNSNYELLNYVIVHEIRDYHKRSGVSLYIQKYFESKIRNDLVINCKDIESVSVELLHEKKRSNLFNVVYRPPNGKIEPLENFFKNLFKRTRSQRFFEFNISKWYDTTHK